MFLMSEGIPIVDRYACTTSYGNAMSVPDTDPIRETGERDAIAQVDDRDDVSRRGCYGHPLRTGFACARPLALCEGEGPPLSFGHFPRERGKP